MVVAPYLDSPLFMFEAGEESALQSEWMSFCTSDDVFGFACENLERNVPLGSPGRQGFLR